MRGRAAVVLTLLILVLSGCGGSASDEAGAPAPQDLSTEVLIVDVRTPEEFAETHVIDAVNVDVQAPDFDERIAELPKDGAYLVYCRSGNRSAQAIERMRALGFTDVEDGGGLDDMESAGYPFTS